MISNSLSPRDNCISLVMLFPCSAADKVLDWDRP